MQPDAINLSFHIYSGILTARSLHIFTLIHTAATCLYSSFTLFFLSGLNDIFNFI